MMSRRGDHVPRGLRAAEAVRVRAREVFEIAEEGALAKRSEVSHANKNFLSKEVRWLSKMILSKEVGFNQQKWLLSN